MKRCDLCDKESSLTTPWSSFSFIQEEGYKDLCHSCDKNLYELEKLIDERIEFLKAPLLKKAWFKFRDSFK